MLPLFLLACIVASPDGDGKDESDSGTPEVGDSGETATGDTDTADGGNESGDTHEGDGETAEGETGEGDTDTAGDDSGTGGTDTGGDDTSGHETGDTGSADLDRDGDGYTEATGDCDDSDPTANPGATESCDDLDNDCDGTVDEDLDRTWWPDADADSYGDDAGASVEACSAPSGYAARTGDCHDADSAVSPAATETCDNGVDDDCSGDASGCGMEGEVSSGEADDVLELGGSGSGATGNECASVLAILGDVSADGADDLALGCPGWGSVGTEAGSAEIWTGLGSALSNVSPELWGDEGDQRLGSALSGLADFGGVARWAVATGAPGDPTNGTGAGAVLFFLDPSYVVEASDADGMLLGESAGDEAGSTLSELADLDGDGTDDLGVGAPSAGSGAGKVYVVTTLTTGTTDLGEFDIAPEGEAAGDAAGSCLATVDDTDGDGLSDFAVGAPLEDTGGSNSGAVYLLTAADGTPSSLADATAKFTGVAAGDHAGAAVRAAGDLDGDGLGDLITGAPLEDTAGSGAGAGYVALGGTSGASSLSASWLILYGEAAGDEAGTTVDGGADFDGDGTDDLVIGAPANSTGGSDAGAAYVVLSPSAGTLALSSASAAFRGAADEAAGGSLLFLGDANGDGIEDLAIGSVGGDSASITVFFGGSE